MSNNSTSSDIYSTENPNYAVHIMCVLPEYFNLCFLSCGLYGMYQGIEISHPLYAVLYLNMIVPLITSILDIVVFFFVSTYNYILFSNIMIALASVFHCSSWCVTSALRFVYIIYGNWFNNLIQSQKLQCTGAVVMTCVLTVGLFLPSLALIISYGKLNFSFSFNKLYFGWVYLILAADCKCWSWQCLDKETEKSKRGLLIL